MKRVLRIALPLLFCVVLCLCIGRVAWAEPVLTSAANPIRTSVTNGELIFYSAASDNITSAETGDTVYFSCVPYSGYKIDSVRIVSIATGVNISAISQIDMYSFVMPDGGVEVSLICVSSKSVITFVVDPPGASARLVIDGIEYAEATHSAASFSIEPGKVIKIESATDGYIVDHIACSAGTVSGNNYLVPAADDNVGIILKKSGQDSKPPFDLSRDAWSFGNNASVFNPWSDFFGLSHYFISDFDFQRLIDNASNVEKVLLRKHKDDTWSGSCYGMSVSAILVKMGVLSVSDFENGRTCLHDVSNPNDDQIESLINYYHLQQFLALSQFEAGGFMVLPDNKKLETIEDLAKDAVTTGNPFLIGIEGDGGHAVVGYGFERGTYIKNNTTYNSRILIYDPNYPEGDEDCYLYYNKGTADWLIPNHSKMNVLQRAINEVFILDQAEYGDTADDCYYVVHYIPADDQEVVVLHYNGEDYQLSLDEDGSGLRFIHISDGSSGSSSKYYLIPPGAPDYRFQIVGGVELEFIAGDVMFNASTENASEITVIDDGQMSFTTNGEFEISTVFNDNLCTTPWYKIALSGEADGEIKMCQELTGFKLEGDLNSVVFSAANDDSTINLSISTNADTVLVEEADGGLAAFIDKDGDGEYETKIEDGTESVIYTIRNSPYTKGSNTSIYIEPLQHRSFVSYAVSDSEAGDPLTPIMESGYVTITTTSEDGHSVSQYSMVLGHELLDTFPAGTYYLWGLQNDGAKTLIGSFVINVAEDVIAIVNGIECRSVEEINVAIHDADDPVITVIAERTIPYEPYSGTVSLSGIPWEQGQCVVISKDAALDLNGGTVCGLVINGSKLLVKDSTNGAGKATGAFDLKGITVMYDIGGLPRFGIKKASLTVTGGSFIPDFNVAQYLADRYTVESADGWDRVVPLSYTVSYDANGGGGAPESQSKAHGEALTLTDAVPGRTGWYFIGWAESPDAVDPDYPRPGGTFTRDADTVLYAVWAQPDLVLPASIAEIGEEAFACGAFRFAELPKHAVAIGPRAFADCPKLRYIYIYDEVTDIAADAFGDKESLTVFGVGPYRGVKSVAQSYAEARGFTFIPLSYRVQLIVTPSAPYILVGP